MLHTDGYFINFDISPAAAFSGFITRSIPTASVRSVISSSYPGFLTLATVCFAPSFFPASEQSILSSSLFVTEIKRSASSIPASLSTFKLVQLPFTHITSKLLFIRSKAVILLSIIVTLSFPVERFFAIA